MKMEGKVAVLNATNLLASKARKTERNFKMAERVIVKIKSL